MRRRRGRFTTLVALITLATSLALPSAALGAKGTSVTADVEALISTVSTGERMAFTAQLTNSGSSTINHVRFEGSAPGSSYESGSAPCAGGGESVSCDLGQLVAGASIHLEFLFRAPTGVGTLLFRGTFSGDAHKGTPGSKMDTWQDSAAVEVIEPVEGYGSWILAGQQLSGQLGESNVQQSSVQLGAVNFAYAAVLTHGSDDPACDPGLLGYFGQTLNLSIAGGHDFFAEGELIKATIDYSEEASAGRTALTVRMMHRSDDGVCQELPRCLSADLLDELGLPHVACFHAEDYVSEEGEIRLRVHLELHHNGSVKGF